MDRPGGVKRRSQRPDHDNRVAFPSGCPQNPEERRWMPAPPGRRAACYDIRGWGPMTGRRRKPSPRKYVLPWYLRYARRLALLSGATVGIAAGVAVISSSGCETSCNGCVRISGTGGAGGTQGVAPNPDAGGFGGAGGFMGIVVVPSDAATDGKDGARPDAIVDAGADDA